MWLSTPCSAGETEKIKDLRSGCENSCRTASIRPAGTVSAPLLGYSVEVQLGSKG